MLLKQTKIMERESFIFYKSWFEVIRDESKEVQWEIINAIIEYAFNDNLVELMPKSRLAFKFIKRDIDKATEKYQEYIDKQRDNGKKGGRPRKETQAFSENPKNPSLFSKTQKSLNVNDNVNVNNIPPNPPEGEMVEEIDFLKLKDFINQETGKSFKMINEATRRKYKARLKEKYTKEDIINAIKNAVADDFHRDNGFKYLTPEYFSRAVTLDKYAFRATETPQKSTKNIPAGVWSV